MRHSTRLTVGTNEPIRRHKPRTVRSETFRRNALNLLNGIPIGLRSGEYCGRYCTAARSASIDSLTPELCGPEGYLLPRRPRALPARTRILCADSRLLHSVNACINNANSPVLPRTSLCLATLRHPRLESITQTTSDTPAGAVPHPRCSLHHPHILGRHFTACDVKGVILVDGRLPALQADAVGYRPSTPPPVATANSLNATLRGGLMLPCGA